MYNNQGTLNTILYCSRIQEIFENTKLMKFNMYKFILASTFNKYLNLNIPIKMLYTEMASLFIIMLINEGCF